MWNFAVFNFSIICKRSGKKQTDNNFYKNNDTFETKFARHVSVVQTSFQMCRYFYKNCLSKFS